MKRERGTPEMETKTVTIHTTSADADYEFEVSPQEANRIVDTFLH
jgi:hypothetical protein